MEATVWQSYQKKKGVSQIPDIQDIADSREFVRKLVEEYRQLGMKLPKTGCLPAKPRQAR